MTIRFTHPRLAASLAALGLALAACSPAAETAAPTVAAAEPEAPAPAPDNAPTAMPIANFTLADQTGASHELYASKDARAVVLIMQGVGCPIVQKMTPDLKKVLADFDGKGVEFMMVNSNMQDTPAMIADEATKFDIKLPILKDADQKVGKDIHAVRTAEVFVVDPKTWTIVYHGPLNDRLTYGREKAVAENNYVSDVLTAVLAGQTPPAIKQEADGCIINFT